MGHSLVATVDKAELAEKAKDDAGKLILQLVPRPHTHHILSFLHFWKHHSPMNN